MFDEPTRRASQGNLQGFGDALAGRGADLNQTIQVAPALFGHLGSVMANLSAPRTELPVVLQGARATPRASSRRSRRPTRTCSRRWPTPSRRSRATRRRSRTTISKSPPTLRAGTESLRVQRPFLEHTAALSRDLDTATTELRGALPTVNSALRVGTPVQRRSVALNDNLQGALGALEDLVKAPDHGRLAARPDGHRRHAAAPAALPGPVRDGLQLLEPSSGPSRPSTSRRPTTPAPRSARC